ncbi:MAG TPA: hypothetical protein VEY33_15805 [Gemmatimonadota bacterium]|nr:hypothetical protein [Gemmatimonadota bacterium]
MLGLIPSRTTAPSGPCTRPPDKARGELPAFPELAVFHTIEVIGGAVGRLDAMLSEGVRRGELRLLDVRTVARVTVSALITYGLWLASPAIYGDLTGLDHERAEDAAIDFLIAVVGGAAE